MSFKNKILSLSLLLLLVAPVLLVGQGNQGSVLGVVDENTEQQSSKQAFVGSIGGGVLETKNNTETDNAEVFGLVEWRDSKEGTVISDKFTVASAVDVYSERGHLNIIVGDSSKSLSPETLLVVNRETFIALGGNPEVEKTLTVKVVKN